MELSKNAIRLDLIELDYFIILFYISLHISQIYYL